MPGKITLRTRAYRWMGEFRTKHPIAAKVIRGAVPVVSAGIGTAVDLFMSYGIPRESLAVTVPAFTAAGEAARIHISNRIRITEQAESLEIKGKKEEDLKKSIAEKDTKIDELKIAGDAAQLWTQVKDIADHGKGTLAGRAQSVLDQWDGLVKTTRALTEGYEEQIRQYPYKNIRLLGEGSQAFVWEAKHLKLDRIDVLKVLRPEYKDDKEMTGRFDYEAKQLSNVSKRLKDLNHPGVPMVFDINYNLEGLPYIAMEHIEGESLHAKLEKSGRIDPAEAIRIMLFLAKTFTVVHQEGLVHRDIKPENILIEDKTGIPKVIDFGIAKNVKKDAGLTMVKGRVQGTPEYMSPEAIRAEQLDIRSDIYGLGVVFYEMLCGEAPHRIGGGDITEQKFFDFAKKVMTEPIPDIRTKAPQIPEAISILLMKMLAKNRNERPGHNQIIAVLQKYYLAGGMV